MQANAEILAIAAGRPYLCDCLYIVKSCWVLHTIQKFSKETPLFVRKSVFHVIKETLGKKSLNCYR